MARDELENFISAAKWRGENRKEFENRAPPLLNIDDSGIQAQIHIAINRIIRVKSAGPCPLPLSFTSPKLNLKNI
jgi:hypothetical protein